MSQLYTRVIRDKAKNKLQDKPINNEEGDEKYEVIDSNVKVTEDTEDNVIVDPVVYMAWTHPVTKGKEQFIIDTGCLGSHIFKDTELLTRLHKSSVSVRLAKLIQPTCVAISSILTSTF
jgi:hypothetical protein